MAPIQNLRFSGRARRPVRRPVFSPDMAPMVGLGFLLVSFFLMAADYAKPAVMQLTMPAQPEPDEIPIGCWLPSSSELTVLLGTNNRVYYYEGLLIAEETELHQTDYSAAGLRQVLMSKQTPSLLVLIKPDNQASYQNLVDALDEMNITDTKKYALVDLTAEDRELLSKHGAL